MKDIVLLGDKIHIRPLDSHGKPIQNLQPFVSQLTEYDTDGIINIAAPIANNQIIRLRKGMDYLLYFYTDKGLYQSRAEVIDNLRDNNVVITRVRLTSDFEKIQRRQFYRLELLHDIEYRIVTSEEEILTKKLASKDAIAQEIEDYKNRLSDLQRHWYKVSITDLSGGGTRFNTNQIHNPGDNIIIRLEFISGGTYKKLELLGIILSATELYNNPKTIEYRIEFKDMDKKDREKLIKFIFEEERRRRSKEKA
ncbi:MAG: flagellar brake protein [Clostridiales bacterium]|nr:flagellar brake protein [Clostridiales bacterium]